MNPGDPVVLKSLGLARKSASYLGLVWLSTYAYFISRLSRPAAAASRAPGASSGSRADCSSCSACAWPREHRWQQAGGPLPCCSRTLCILVLRGCQPWPRWRCCWRWPSADDQRPRGPRPRRARPRSAAVLADFWRAHDGARLIGAPLTGERPAGSLVTQVFERARLRVTSDYPPGRQIALGRPEYEALDGRQFRPVPGVRLEPPRSSLTSKPPLAISIYGRYPDASGTRRAGCRSSVCRSPRSW